MASWLRKLRTPWTLVTALSALLLLTVLFATTTTTASFGVYNPEWNGGSDLQQEAEAVGSQSSLAVNTSVYTTVPPTETVAVILSPEQAYDQTETDRVESFVRQGGTLVVAEDFGPHSNELLAGLGATTRIDGRLLRDDRYYYQSPNITVATDVTPHPMTRGVEQLTLNRGSVLILNETNDTQVLANSSELAYLDSNRNGEFDESETLGQRPVMAIESIGQGQVIVISDPSMLINAMIERPGNRAFIQNVFRSNERVIFDYSQTETIPPLSYALLNVRDSTVLQFIIGIVGLTAVVVINRRVLPTKPEEATQGGDPVDTQVLFERLRQEHPEWDAKRLQRVAEARSQTDEETGSGRRDIE